MLRLTGVATKVDRRSGTKVNANGEARDWAFTSVRVLVQGMEVVEASIWSDAAVPVPSVGEPVDYAVATSVRPGYDGGRPSVSVSVDHVWQD